jgi:hypothetical protein
MSVGCARPGSNAATQGLARFHRRSEHKLAPCAVPQFPRPLSRRILRRAGGVFDGERNILRNLRVLPDESEIGLPHRNRAGLMHVNHMTGAAWVFSRNDGSGRGSGKR